MKKEILKRNFFNKIKILKELYLKAIVIFILSLFLVYFFKYIPNEIQVKLFKHKKELLELTSNNFRNISLFFISIVIGSYSIVQALLDDESLEVLTNNKENEPSKFTYINIYFYSYVIILLTVVLFNGGIEVLLKVDKIIFFIKNLDFTQEVFNKVFKIIISFQIAMVISISYEFKIFIRNLYDTFKVTTYIKVTRAVSTKEKILLINNYLFDKHLIDYLSTELTSEAYEKMKNIMGKDFSLNEAIKYIKKNS